MGVTRAKENNNDSQPSNQVIQPPKLRPVSFLSPPQMVLPNQIPTPRSHSKPKNSTQHKSLSLAPSLKLSPNKPTNEPKKLTSPYGAIRNHFWRDELDSICLDVLLKDWESKIYTPSRKSITDNNTYNKNELTKALALIRTDLNIFIERLSIDILTLLKLPTIDATINNQIHHHITTISDAHTCDKLIINFSESLQKSNASLFIFTPLPIPTQKLEPFARNEEKTSIDTKKWDALYPAFYHSISSICELAAQKKAVDYQVDLNDIWLAQGMPHYYQMECWIQIAKNQLSRQTNKSNGSWFSSCCCFFRPEKAIKNIYAILANLDTEPLKTELVGQTLVALEKIAPNLKRDLGGRQQIR